LKISIWNSGERAGRIFTLFLKENGGGDSFEGQLFLGTSRVTILGSLGNMKLEWRKWVSGESRTTAISTSMVGLGSAGYGMSRLGHWTGLKPLDAASVKTMGPLAGNTEEVYSLQDPAPSAGLE